MERSGPITVGDDHAMRDAVALANDELQMGYAAAAEGNLGRARVCARRAVGTFLQSIAACLDGDVGTHAMANLRWLQECGAIPPEQREAAARLLIGARAELAGEVVSLDPLA